MLTVQEHDLSFTDKKESDKQNYALIMSSQDCDNESMSNNPYYNNNYSQSKYHSQYTSSPRQFKSFSSIQNNNNLYNTNFIEQRPYYNNYTHTPIYTHIYNKYQPSTSLNYKSKSKTRHQIPTDDLVNSVCSNLYVNQYNAMNKCKSAGIIPYTIHNNKLLFLFQNNESPIKKKNGGWNDFGGKCNNDSEKTWDIASREFSEETNCLFYFKDQKDSDEHENYFNLLKKQPVPYEKSTIDLLKSIIPISQKYFSNKITEYAIPICASSKEIYISYFVKVNYIEEFDLPESEDFHVEYEERYIRKCKWFTIEDLTQVDESVFHKRLQITKIRQRIINYNDKGLFV